MSQPLTHPDLDRLFAKLLDEGLQGSEMELLSEAIRQDASLRELYRKYMVVDALLQWALAPPLLRSVGEEGSEFRDQGTGISNPQSPIPDPLPLIPPIILDLSPALPPSLFSLDSPLGSFLFSYTVSALILGIGALIGLGVQSAPRPTSRLCGADCQFVRRRTDFQSVRRKASPARQAGPTAGRPDHRHGRLPMGRSPHRADRLRQGIAGPQVRPGLGLHGNRLRHRREGHPPRPLRL